MNDEDPKIPLLIGTWPPPGKRLHKSELKLRWPPKSNMDRAFCNWALGREDPWGNVYEKFIRVWYYTYLRFLRA